MDENLHRLEANEQALFPQRFAVSRVTSAPLIDSITTSDQDQDAGVKFLSREGPELNVQPGRETAMVW